MLHLSRLPDNVRYFLRGTQQFFRFRHHLVFSWTLILLVVCDDKATLCGLCRLGPKHLCEWHLRRLLCASYWCARAVLWWFVEAVLAVLPPAEDGTVLLIVNKGLRRVCGAGRRPGPQHGLGELASRTGCCRCGRQPAASSRVVEKAVGGVDRYRTNTSFRVCTWSPVCRRYRYRA